MAEFAASTCLEPFQPRPGKFAFSLSEEVFELTDDPFEWSLDSLFAKFDLDGLISCAVEKRFLEMGGQIRVGGVQTDSKGFRQTIQLGVVISLHPFGRFSPRGNCAAGQRSVVIRNDE